MQAATRFFLPEGRKNSTGAELHEEWRPYFFGAPEGPGKGYSIDSHVSSLLWVQMVLLRKPCKIKRTFILIRMIGYDGGY